MKQMKNANPGGKLMFALSSRVAGSNADKNSVIPQMIGVIKMNITNHNHSKLIMLFGLILISSSWAATVYASGTTWVTANHQLVIHNAEKVNGVYYLRSDRVVNATMRADYRGVDLSKFKQWSATATFFRPGASYFPSFSRTSRENMPAPLSINLGLSVGGDMCGQTGDLGPEVSLTPNYTTLTAATRLHVAIDCQVPTITTVNGLPPNRFNHRSCVGTRSNYPLSIGLQDDTGIRSVEVSSNNRRLTISPSIINMDQIKKSAQKNRYTADFSMQAAPASEHRPLEPISHARITARVTDMAGHHKESHFEVNLDVGDMYRFDPVPLRAITVGQRTAFGGNIVKQTCSDEVHSFSWRIIKVPNSTSSAGPAVNIAGNKALRSPNRMGTRTPFIVPFTPPHSGYYRLQILDSHNTMFYTSPALQVIPTAIRTPHTTKKVSPTPARRRSGPRFERKF